MPKLSAHSSADFVKLLYIGNSGTGKTGSLVSLVKEGYKIRVLDLDNGIEVLKHFVLAQCPENVDLVDYETERDQYKSSALGPTTRPKAFTNSLKLLDKWSDESIPAEWGADTIFVLDSLSGLGRAALAWATGLNPTSKDPRQWYKQAQDAVENVVATLTSEAFRANVIVISHVNLVEGADGMTKGYANAIGKALGPVLPRYFNTLILAESTGQGNNVRRKIKTVPTGMIDLKAANPFKVENELPLESGMATLFSALKSA